MIGVSAVSMADVIGHNNTKALLCGALQSSRIGHAYIFEGDTGIGRLSLAKAFAEEIVGCGGRFTADSHPDIIIVTNEKYGVSKKQTNISVDTIRSMKSDVYIKPYMSEHKVYIIPNADSMAEVAQNSLLKVFEEPPEYCTIILIAQNSNRFLQTILSRASLIKMRPLDREAVKDYLINNCSIDCGQADPLAVMSRGSIGRALTLAGDDESVKLRAEVIGHLVNISRSGARPLYDFIRFLKQNRADIQTILDIMADWSSDVLHIKLGGEIINADMREQLQEFCSRVTREAALKFSEIITKYSLALNRNINYPIAVSCMATEYWEEIHGRNYRSAF